MPVDRSIGDELAATLVGLYRDVETRLVGDISRRLASGIDRSDWAERKLAGVSDLRKQTEKLLVAVTGELGPRVEQALVLAYTRGGREATKEIARITGTTDRLGAIRRSVSAIDAVQRLIWALVSRLRGTHVQILRWTIDAYRTTVARSSVGVLTGTMTRRQAAQQAWSQLLNRGITGFRDSAGRRWELASYVEMATRTTTAHAAVQGHLDRLGDANIELVIVSNAPQECKLCRPWEGKVLSRSGSGPHTVEVEHPIHDYQMVKVQVAGSVIDAAEAGLMHPNCRHSLSAYLPGVTKAPTNTEDVKGDKNRQRHRVLERNLRRWKLRQIGAIDPAEKQLTAAKVNAWSEAIAQHVKDTGLIRQPAREVVGVAR